MDNMTKYLREDGVETLIKTILTTMATEGYLPYLKNLIIDEMNRSTSVEVKINNDFSALVDMMGILEEEMNNTIGDISPIIVVECNIIDANTFQINEYPSGYNKTNTIIVSNKIVQNDGSINDIIMHLTYKDTNIIGKVFDYNLEDIKRLYVYLRKTESIII